MIKELFLFTNRNCLAFDENGMQVPQSAISYSSINPPAARQMIHYAEHLYISKFREWKHEISKDEMLSLLGLKEAQDLRQQRGK